MAHLIAGTVAALLALCGMGFYLLCGWSAITFRRRARQRKASDFSPAVSILKPLRGLDPEMYESFRSHCLLEYPEYELIFGVSDPEDPAAEAVRRLMREFPERQIRLMVCPQALGNNPKTSNVAQMLVQARHSFILINDSDIRVPEDYLKRVMALFAAPEIGLVTCPYRGRAARTLGSRLEALGISTDFIPGVLAAQQIEGGLHFALGSTLAVRRSALEAIGGFETLVDYLADDFELGRRVADAGFKVVLADLVVETHLPAYSFDGFFRHQLRWSRSTRDSRRAGYIGLALTFGVPWAMLSVLFTAGSWWSWVVLAAALLLRCAVALQVGAGIVGDPKVSKNLWLLPLRDVIALGVWIASFGGREVNWRGDTFVLDNGKIRPANLHLQKLVSAGDLERDKVSAHS